MLEPTVLDLNPDAPTSTISSCFWILDSLREELTVSRPVSKSNLYAEIVKKNE